MKAPVTSPAIATTIVGTRGKVPSTMRNPANGRMISLGIGGIPKLSTVVSAYRPGNPIVAKMKTMTSTIVPINENVTVGSPRGGAAQVRSRVGRGVEDQAERNAESGVGSRGDPFGVERGLATTAGDRWATASERDGERDADLDLFRSPGRIVHRVAKLVEQLLFVGRNGVGDHRT